MPCSLNVIYLHVFILLPPVDLPPGEHPGLVLPVGGGWGGPHQTPQPYPAGPHVLTGTKDGHAGGTAGQTVTSQSVIEFIMRKSLGRMHFHLEINRYGSM